MFVKLLKHEWRANRGLIGLLCAVIGGSGLLSGGIMRYTLWSGLMGNNAAVAIYTFVLSAVLIAGIVCCVLPTYLLVYRFYQSRFTDRGYLMLTLPVTTHQHLLSSIACSVVGILLTTVTAVVSFAAGIAFFLSMFREGSAAELIEQVWSSLVDSGAVQALADDHLGLQLLPGIIAIVADIILLMLAVTVGSQSVKHPVLKGAAVYILTDMVVSEGCALLVEAIGDQGLVMMLTGVIYGALAVGAYFIMHHIIDKRLNLT